MHKNPVDSLLRILVCAGDVPANVQMSLKCPPSCHFPDSHSYPPNIFWGAHPLIVDWCCLVEASGHIAGA